MAAAGILQQENIIFTLSMLLIMSPLSWIIAFFRNIPDVVFQRNGER